MVESSQASESGEWSSLVCFYIDYSRVCVCVLAVLWTSPNSWVAHLWWKTGLPDSFLGCPNDFDLSLTYFFLVINTTFACLLFNHVLTYRELGRPSGDFVGDVASPDRIMGRIWRLGDHLSTALVLGAWTSADTKTVKFVFRICISLALKT